MSFILALLKVSLKCYSKLLCLFGVAATCYPLDAVTIYGDLPSDKYYRSEFFFFLQFFKATFKRYLNNIQFDFLVYYNASR